MLINHQIFGLMNQLIRIFEQIKIKWFLSFVLLFTLTSNVLAQKEVTGTVLDNTGVPLPGASIIEEGTNNGVVTDFDGNFKITVESENSIIVISYIGFEEQKISASQSPINVQLKESQSSLDEIVLIGYGQSTKRNVTGAISSVKLEESPLTSLPNPNLLEALKGKMAGLNIGATNVAGGNPSLIIRGQNSLKASNYPLIIVDGVVFNGSLNEINPNNIAKVDVLKDASSTAVYGSQAANGVILITTKKGELGKPQISLSTTTGIQTYTKRPKMRDGEGFIQMRYDVRKLQGADPADLEIDRLLSDKELAAYNAGHTVDWWDEIVSPAPYQDYQLSLSGASENVNYYVSGNYLDQEGITFNDQFRKFTIFSKVGAQITDWLNYQLTLSATSKNADGTPADLEKATIMAPYSYVHSTIPGYENWYERYPQQTTTLFSPYWRTQEYDEDRNQNYRSINTIKVNVPWIEGLNYTFKYSLNRWEGHQARFHHEQEFVNTLNEADLMDQSKYLNKTNGWRNNTQRTDWYLNHIINYNQTFGDHSVDATLLAERQKETTRKIFFKAGDFSQAGTTVLGVNSLQLGSADQQSGYTQESQLQQLAYLARLNYVYKKRYHLSGSIRKDGYSGFASGNKYGVFRSIAGAWTLSEESFIKDNWKFANFLKFRVSYGENGNPSIGPYATFPTIATDQYLFGTQTVNTAYVNKLANKSLKWEQTNSLNFGLDFAFFENRFNGTINYYDSKTTNLLINRSIPTMNGFSSVSDNLGELNNKGLEIELNSVNIKNDNFEWDSGLNFWRNRNKIVSLYGLDGDGDGVEDDDISNSYFIGKPLGAIYDLTFDGIIQEGDTEYMDTYGGIPGDIKFKDLNDDGKIGPDDRSIIGYTKPNFTVGLSNTFTYRNFELYMMMGAVVGGGKDNYYLASNQYAYNPNTLYGGLANWLDKEYWMPENPSNTIPRPTYNNPYRYSFPKRHDFFRLQDLILTYRLQPDFLRSISMSQLSFNIAAKNLITITDWEGLDPETATSYAGVNGFPVMKTISFGMKASF